MSRHSLPGKTVSTLSSKESRWCPNERSSQLQLNEVNTVIVEFIIVFMFMTNGGDDLPWTWSFKLGVQVATLHGVKLFTCRLVSFPWINGWFSSNGMIKGVG